MNNAQFAGSNKQFLMACSKAGIPATTRQASKFHNEKGLAYRILTDKIKVEKNSTGNFVKITKQLKEK